MTISRKIIGGYIVILALLMLVAGVALYALEQIQLSYSHFLRVDERLKESADELRVAAFTQQTYVRGLLLYPELDKENLDFLRENDNQFKQILAKMHKLISSGEGIVLVKGLQSLHEELKQAQGTVAGLVREQKREEARTFVGEKFRPLSAALVDKARHFHQWQSLLLEKRTSEVTEKVNLYTYMLGIVSLLAILVGLSIGMNLGRSITRQLQASIAQLSSSSAEILATTAQVASGAAETAAAVSETTSTVEEVKQTAQLASQKAKLVSESAQKASNISQAGLKSVEDAIHGMHRIREQMESIAGNIVHLSEQSNAIAGIIATVNDLAEQSNLLAVNAAIEAARAGEQGKSFGVVAQEIRSLAEQSRQATAQVRLILGEIQRITNLAVLATEQGSKVVEGGVKQSTDTDAAIRLLSASINDAAQAAIQIAASSQQQMIGMDQVALAMNDIKQASEQNVAGTRQAEQAAHSLHEMGVELGTLVGVKGSAG